MIPRARRFARAALLALLVLSSPVGGRPVVVADQSPAPGPSSSPSIIDTGDPRSNGQGPGLVGSPFAILGGVIVLGLVSAAGTALYLRVTDRR